MSENPGAKAEFEEIEHTADWALRVRGGDLRALLSNAAHGMYYLLGTEPDDIPVDVEEQFDIDAIDAESMLVNWLSELAYWVETEELIFHEFDFKEVTPTHLQAAVRGGRASNLKKHIKAVTYHNLKVTETEDGLTATVVFDV